MSNITEKQPHLVLQALGDLKATISILQMNVPFPPPKKLEKVVREIQHRSEELRPKEPTPLQSELALKHWEIAISSSDFSILTRRDIKTLCAMEDVVQQKPFLTLLKEREIDFSPARIERLVLTCHQLWQGHVNHTDLISWLYKRVRDYRGKRRLLVCWQQNLDKILSPIATEELGKELIHYREPLANLIERYKLLVSDSHFVKQTAHKALMLVCDQLSPLRNEYDPALWTYLLGTPLKYADGLLNYAQNSSPWLAGLVLELHEYQQSKGIPHPAQEQLKQYLIQQKGDPRIESGRWKDFHPEARGIVIQWLSEADIEFFFNMIIQNDRQGRKRFWLQYLGKITGSVVAIGHWHYINHKADLDKFEKEGRYFARLSRDREISAFILDFGQYIVVDFSTNGRAYVYEKSVFFKRLGIQSIYQSKYINAANLKDSQQPEYAMRAFPHIGNWLNTLKQYLATLGIRGG